MRPASLARLFERAGARAPEPILGTDSKGFRLCVDCRRTMAKVTLWRVPLDLCEVHGYWFDRNELELALSPAQREAVLREIAAEEEARRGRDAGGGAGDVFLLGAVVTLEAAPLILILLDVILHLR